MLQSLHVRLSGFIRLALQSAKLQYGAGKSHRAAEDFAIFDYEYVR